VPHGLLEGHHPGLIVDQGQVDHAKGRLELGVGIELVQDHLRIGILLQDHDHPHAVAIRFVPQIADALDDPAAHQQRDLLDQGCLVHLIGQLGDDNGGAVVGLGLDLGAGAHHHPAAAAGHIVVNAPTPVDDTAGGKIRALHMFEQGECFEVGVIQHGDQAIAYLAQVVGRDLGRHTHRDAIGAVDQEVGYQRRHD